MKKETITTEQIKQDILRGFKTPKEMSESQYVKWTVIALITGILLLVIEYFYPSVMIGFLVCVIVMVPLVLIASAIGTWYKKKRFCMDDYEITTEKLAYKNEEHYYARKTRHTTRPVDNYNLYFENGKDWQIPDRNYLWSADCQFSDRFIYDNVHRDDTFVVVTNKKTGQIVTAYPMKFFEYREGETTCNKTKDAF